MDTRATTRGEALREHGTSWGSTKNSDSWGSEYTSAALTEAQRAEALPASASEPAFTEAFYAEALTAGCAVSRGPELCYRPAMNLPNPVSRRTFLTVAGALPFAIRASAAQKKVPVGLELYSVRDALTKDLNGTVTAVAKLGYEVVEFYSPYFSWTPQAAKDVRKLMDDLGIRCLSTHNSPAAIAPDGIQKAIELNQILGSRDIIVASAGKVIGHRRLEGVWRPVERGRRHTEAGGHVHRLPQSRDGMAADRGAASRWTCSPPAR